LSGSDQERKNEERAELKDHESPRV